MLFVTYHFSSFVVFDSAVHACLCCSFFVSKDDTDVNVAAVAAALALVAAAKALVAAETATLVALLDAT